VNSIRILFNSGDSVSKRVGVRAQAVLALCAVAFGLTGCSPGLREVSFTFDRPTPSPLEAARCAARSSGWNITSSDDRGFSATQAFGGDDVPVNLNVMKGPDGKTLTATVANPRGIIGNGEYYTRDFAAAFARCGATPSVQYPEG
jgi:hypothetical protein